jgi:hypothetical protein
MLLFSLGCDVGDAFRFDGLNRPAPPRRLEQRLVGIAHIVDDDLGAGRDKGEDPWAKGGRIARWRREQYGMTPMPRVARARTGIAATPGRACAYRRSSR